MKANQVWIVRCEDIGQGDESDESSVLFEMVFPTREAAHQVYFAAYAKFADCPWLRWSLNMALYNDVEYALHHIEEIAKEEM